MFVSVIVPVYNAGLTLRECLQSVVAQDYPKNGYEIIVVDNNSTDGSIGIAKSFGMVRLYCQKNIQGCAPTRNKGARLAKGDVLVFFDADQIMDHNYLSNILNGIECHDYGAIAGAAIPNMASETLVADYMSRERDPREGQETCNFFGGGSFAIKKSIFQTLGGFDEQLITTEDLDLSQKVIDSGRKIRYRPEAFCYHKERTSVVSLLKREFYFGVGTYIRGKKHPALSVTLLSRTFDSAFKTLLFTVVAVKKVFFILLGIEKYRELQIVILDLIMHWTKTVGIMLGNKFYKDTLRSSTRSK